MNIGRVVAQICRRHDLGPMGAFEAPGAISYQTSVHLGAKFFRVAFGSWKSAQWSARYAPDKCDPIGPFILDPWAPGAHILRTSKVVPISLEKKFYVKPVETKTWIVNYFGNFQGQKGPKSMTPGGHDLHTSWKYLLHACKTSFIDTQQKWPKPEFWSNLAFFIP